VPARLLGAAHNGDAATVRSLLEAGANATAVGMRGLTALHYAARGGHLEAARALLQFGAAPDAVIGLGMYRPLHLAAQFDHLDVVALLLQAGALPLHDPTGQLKSPLHLAQSPAVVRLLLAAGAEANLAFDPRGNTPLHDAARRGCPQSVALLLEAGAAPNALNHADSSVLHEGVVHPGVVRLLLAAGARVDARRGGDGMQPIHAAAAADSIRFRRPGHHCTSEVVRLLLDAGAQVGAPDANSMQPLHHALENLEQGPISSPEGTGCLCAVHLLMQRGAHLDAKDSNGRTPLSMATDRVRFLSLVLTNRALKHRAPEAHSKRRAALWLVFYLLQAGARDWGTCSPRVADCPGHPSLLSLLYPVMHGCPAALPSLAPRFHADELAQARAALLVLRLRTPLHDPSLHMRVLGLAFSDPTSV